MGPVVFEEAKEKAETPKLALPLAALFPMGPFPKAGIHSCCESMAEVVWWGSVAFLGLGPCGFSLTSSS
jgi:hypothetical protein